MGPICDQDQGAGRHADDSAPRARGCGAENGARYKVNRSDETRLFYVAVTRAQKYLSVSCARHHVITELGGVGLRHSNILASRLPVTALRTQLTAPKRRKAPDPSAFHELHNQWSACNTNTPRCARRDLNPHALASTGT